MGKISDALDKIGSMEGIGEDGANQVKEHFKDPTSSRTLPETKLDNLISPSQDLGRMEHATAESASDDAVSNLVIDRIDEPEEINGTWDDRLFKAVNSDLTMPEVFKSLRTYIMNPSDPHHPPRTIMVSSATSGEGKSFITANLGVSMANGAGRHCVLVDCNLRNPFLARSFGIRQQRGLVEYLKEQEDLADVVKETSIPNLSVLPSGSAAHNPAELLSSARMGGLIKDLSILYEECAIIFDSPPLFTAAESIVLADKADGVIMVVRQGRAKKSIVERFTEVVDRSKIIGIVFNDVPIE